MIHIYGLQNIHLLHSSVVTIGVFDGVHMGHQHLIMRLVEQAHQNSHLAVVLTFFPHPDVVIHTIDKPYYLTSAEQRAQLLIDLGVDCVVTHPFNDDTRQIRAADFVDQLITHLRLDQLWVGGDFAMGYKREGTVPFLIEQGRKKGFSVDVINMVMTKASDDQRVSSSLIREGIRQGKMQQVRQWLGRGYSVSGEVVHGKKLGRTIGFPTANIDFWEQQIIPMNGIYAGWAYLGEERFMTLINVGISPTFEYKGITVEAYLVDFDRDIYGQNLTITFEFFLRPEQKFDGIEALVAQIHRDVEKGITLLSDLPEA